MAFNELILYRLSSEPKASRRTGIEHWFRRDDTYKSVIILVEAFAALASKPLRVDHPFEKDAWTVLRVTSASIECLLNGEAGVQADTVKVKMMSIGKCQEVPTYKSANRPRYE